MIDYQWIAQDKDGRQFLYINKPTRGRGIWGGTVKLGDYLRLGMYEYLDLGPKWKKSLRRVQMLGDVPVLVTDPPESPKFAVGEVWRFGDMGSCLIREVHTDHFLISNVDYTNWRILHESCYGQNGTKLLNADGTPA